MVEYKLSCEVIGHQKDVRTIDAVPATEDKKAGFVSGSRDLTMKMWTQNRSLCNTVSIAKYYIYLFIFIYTP